MVDTNVATTDVVAPVKVLGPPPPGTTAPCNIGEGRGQVMANVFSGGDRSDFAGAENEMWCECYYFCCFLMHDLPFRVQVSQRAHNGSFVF